MFHFQDNKSKPAGVDAGLWQFGGGTNKLKSPLIAGVTTVQNYSYKDYKAIMVANGLNGYGKDKPTKPITAVKPAPAQVKTVSTNNFKIGDKVKIIGSNYVTGQRVPFWVKVSTHTIDKVEPNRVRLKEIFS